MHPDCTFISPFFKINGDASRAHNQLEEKTLGETGHLVTLEDHAKMNVRDKNQSCVCVCMNKLYLKLCFQQPALCSSHGLTAEGKNQKMLGAVRAVIALCISY